MSQEGRAQYELSDLPALGASGAGLKPAGYAVSIYDYTLHDEIETSILRQGEFVTRHPIDIKLLFELALRDATLFHRGSEEEELPSDAFSQFRPDIFFQAWFREQGRAYFFLFKKNLQVTNLQFAELVALLQDLAEDDAGMARDLQFLSHREFNAGVTGLVQSFSIRTRADAQTKYSLIAELYSDLLRTSVVIDPYFGSCSVYFPANLRLDLRRLCALSGYIHSCGDSIYVRNVNKARPNNFFEAIRSHIGLRHDGTERKFFAVYTHEDFSKQDAEEEREQELVHGLADLKLHIEKFFMGDERLVAVIKRLEAEHDLGDRLEVPPPGPFKDTHKARLGRKETIWLLRDYSVGRNGGGRGEDVYYICYEQIFKNDNPFYIFDENKPAWIEHTTTPHTLIAAMINVTKPSWPKEPVLCDPFLGTGTTALEALKYPELRFEGSDNSPLSEIMFRDNLRLFSSPAKALLDLEDFLAGGLQARLKPPSPLTPGERPDFLTHHVLVKDKVTRFISDEGEFRVEDEDEDVLAETLRDLADDARLVFYIQLRTLRRNEGAQRRGSLNWPERHDEETKRLRREIAELRGLREKPGLGEVDGVLTVQGRYSGNCTFGPEYLAAAAGNRLKVATKGVVELEKDKYDVVVADPPYGFNTEENLESLARLYMQMIPIMVRSLRDGGQLVMCLPERSYIGRKSPFFTHKEIVVQQVLAAAKDADREIVSRTLPEPIRLYKPPYYWRSEKALSRTILHFKFRKRDHR